MIPSDFVLAVLAVFARGLFDKYKCIIFGRPVVNNSIIPKSTACFLVSGALYWLYKAFIKGRPVEVYLPPPTKRKIIDGRLHHSGLQSFSQNLIGNDNNYWAKKLHTNRRREILPNIKPESSSTISVDSSKSLYYVPCRCKSLERDCGSQSALSIKSGSEAPDQLKEEVQFDFRGHGDCDWEDKDVSRNRRRRRRITRKTRSGKVYSCVN